MQVVIDSQPPRASTTQPAILQDARPPTKKTASHQVERDRLCSLFDGTTFSTVLLTDRSDSDHFADWGSEQVDRTGPPAASQLVAELLQVADIQPAG